MSPTLPLRQLLPTLADGSDLADPTHQAFRELLGEVDALRKRLHALRATQSSARQTYWRQVGPLAAATVAARRALYAPLEAALLGGYLTRAEMQQVTELLVAIAQDLQARFGEEEAAILALYAPPPTLPEEEELSPVPTPADSPPQPTATGARSRRAARTPAAAPTSETAAEALLGSTKAAYRELARRHHPDRAALAGPEAQRTQTAFMQRITAAYAAGDLAALLTLLAESPTAPTSDVSQALLTRYTRALTEQRAALRQQVAQAQAPTDDQPWSGTEKQQRTRLRETKRALRAETDYLHALRRQLAEPTTLRQALRELAHTGM